MVEAIKVDGMEAAIAEQMKSLVMEDDIGIVDVHLEGNVGI